MKLEPILTEISDIVNKKELLWVVAVILTATLFYMIGWISCRVESRDPINIEDPPEISKIWKIGGIS